MDEVLYAGRYMTRTVNGIMTNTVARVGIKTDSKKLHFEVIDTDEGNMLAYESFSDIDIINAVRAFRLLEQLTLIEEGDIEHCWHAANPNYPPEHQESVDMIVGKTGIGTRERQINDWLPFLDSALESFDEYGLSVNIESIFRELDSRLLTKTHRVGRVIWEHADKYFVFKGLSEDYQEALDFYESKPNGLTQLLNLKGLWDASSMAIRYNDKAEELLQEVIEHFEESLPKLQGKILSATRETRVPLYDQWEFAIYHEHVNHASTKIERAIEFGKFDLDPYPKRNAGEKFIHFHKRFKDFSEILISLEDSCIKLSKIPEIEEQDYKSQSHVHLSNAELVRGELRYLNRLVAENMPEAYKLGRYTGIPVI